MREIKAIIDELNSIDSKWGKVIIDAKELDDIYNGVNGDLLGELIELIREYVKINDSKYMETVSELIADSKVLESVLQYVDKTLIHYNNMSCLREIEKKDKEIVGVFLGDIIENFIVRVDYNFPNEYEQYKIENIETMKKILKSIDCLTEFYVRRFFSKKAIEEDFLEETGLDVDNCKKYAEFVDIYFDKMKINILMQDTEYIKQFIGE